MAKTVKETTKAPTGITITRNNEVLTVTWKIAGRDYGKGQYFQQLINTGKKSSWTPAKNTNIGIRAYSKAVIVKKTSFYPYKGKPILKSVGVRIKGHQKDYTTGSGKKKRKHVMSASGWATKYYTFNPPIRPSISKALNEELTNVCKFSWNVTVANNTTQMFTDVQLQSILVKNSTESDGSKLNWSKALTEIKGSTGDRTFTEDTAILYKDGDTYTRWVRVRSRGPAGNSAWSYACQVYALPNQANVLNTYAEETEEGGFRCIVDWEVTGNQKNPIDRTMVQYTILTPDEDLTCPSGASWTDANISRDTSHGDAAVFSIDDQLGKDQCLFIRVNTQHDGNITYGKPQLSSVGYLRDPSGLSVRTDDNTHKATIQATNNSEIPDSFLVVRYVPAEGDPIPIGVIPHGEASVTVQCPDWSDQSAIAFDVYAVVGSYEKQPREDGVDSYNIVVRMQSQKTISQGGQVPVAPQQVSVHRVEGKPDTVRVSWDWPWSEAGSAEIAWSDHDDAWESTDEPETYTVSNLHASHWNISGLETGRTWYIRVRLIKGSIDNSEDVTYGPWSDINQGTIDLSSAPNKPTLILSDSVIPGDGVTTASWVYTTTDSTYQAYGEVAIVVGEEYTPIAHALTEQHVTIDAAQVGLEVGNVYNLSCRVRSASGRVSEWSDTVSVAIAEPLVCEIAETSLEPDVVEDTIALKEMPFSLTVTGAGEGGLTSVTIERSEDYALDRPDEDKFQGHKGEVVLQTSPPIVGEGQIVFQVEDLLGSLDDGASYLIRAIVQDGLGQRAEATLGFEVHWRDQAVEPSAEITLDQEELIAFIKPLATQGMLPTDVADIYRLSADKPKLIVRGATFGETYVDPFPALGDMGGHRIVTRTKNGDYITEDNRLAMVDSPELGVNPLDNEELLNIIDFDGRQILFYWDSNYSNTWTKDFQRTRYLGGSDQGDWNEGIERTGNLTSRAITVLDQEMVKDVRRLAEYSGLCHVRTADGSSYSADVQVSDDYVDDDQGMVVNYSLSITRVDEQELDGMTLDQWNAENPGEEGE